MNAVLEPTLNIRVKISKNRIMEADLYKELSIDVNSLQQEIINQPAKYATWAVLSDLAEQRLNRLKHSVEEDSISLADKIYIAHKHYQLLSSIRDVFIHRKSTLLTLLGHPEQTGVIDEYQVAVSHLRALTEDIVPYLSPQH